MIKRENMKKIIKIRSNYTISKAKGNYRLPNNEKLSEYIRRLLNEQMEIDNLLIDQDGDFVSGSWEDAKRCYYYFSNDNDKEISFIDHEILIDRFISEML